MRNYKLILILVFMALFSSCTAIFEKDISFEELELSAANDKSSSYHVAEKSKLLPFQGKWQGKNINSHWTIDINATIEIPNVLISDEEWGYYFAVMNWEVDDNKIILTMNDEENRITFTLALGEGTNLNGTHEQYGNVRVVSFKRVSEIAENKERYYGYGEKAKERIRLLREFSQYADDGTNIPFTYTLYQREENQEIIDKYELDSITEGHSDVDLMIVLLNWVCDNISHDGSAGVPQQRDINSLIEYAEENQGINCRGMSMLLADLCRIYGVEAKHIDCMPKEAKFDESHVVVHAYSWKLNQWIMLDPTYRLIITNEQGQYVNLQMLRQSYLNNDKLFPNADAGWNGNSFDIYDYQSYMAKNVFRFSCPTDLYSGADYSNGNIENMLVPVNYSDDMAEYTTTSERAFWGIPD